MIEKQVEIHSFAQVFRLLASPVTQAPPFNPLPSAQHASLIADEACSLAQDASFGVRPSRFEVRAN
jgi:hypothetical protein